MLDVGGVPAFVHCGGVDFDPAKPAVVLVHGAGQDHSHFRFITRALAHRGVSVAAPDLPGHGRSAGSAPDSIRGMAAWVVALLDVLGVERAVLSGHSMGSLIALETAASAPDRVAGIVLTGSGESMPVHPDLQAAADEADRLAVELISGWVHSGSDRLGGHPQPGSWTRGITDRLLERELESTLAGDLAACASYAAADRVSSVSCPITVVVATEDVMTPARAGRNLAATTGARLIEVHGTGHNVVMEHPEPVLAEILRLVGG